jgi:hypothetical protein
MCGIVMHKCVLQNGKYFNHESDFTWDEKYEKVKSREQLKLGDNKMREIFYN